MGKIQKGILGGFSGIVGTVVGATWRGLEIMRSRPKKSSRIPTLRQADQRARFLMAVRFLQPVKPLLRRYFGQPAGTKSRSNLATSYHLTDAVIGTFPSLAIDYSKVILSRGELLGLQDAAATPMSTAILKLTWTDNSGQGQALPTDLIFAAAYNETRKQWEYRMAAATRGTPAFNFQLPAAWVGETVHCWIAVASADDYLYGNSEYFGPLSLV